MAGIISKVDVEEYSSTKNYMKYDIVYLSGYNYFISRIDGNLNLSPSLSNTNSYWYKIGDFTFDIASLWMPSYSSAINIEPRNLRFLLGKGGVNPKTRDGINTIPYKFELSFENRSTREAKSLIAFFEFIGKKYAFYYTLPLPYENKIKFYCEEYSLNYERFNEFSVVSVFVQDFTPFLDVGSSGQGQSNLV